MEIHRVFWKKATDVSEELWKEGGGNFPLNRCYLSTRLHGITYQKSAVMIFNPMRTSGLTTAFNFVNSINWLVFVKRDIYTA
jgi:hypothetical protein